MINYSLDNQNSIEDIVLMNMYTRHRDTFRERIPASIIFKEKGDFACSIFYAYYSLLHSVIHMCLYRIFFLYIRIASWICTWERSHSILKARTIPIMYDQARMIIIVFNRIVYTQNFMKYIYIFIWIYDNKQYNVYMRLNNVINDVWLLLANIFIYCKNICIFWFSDNLS